MAFTFLVEDGTGLAAATSYVSVSNADDIVYINYNNTSAWDALTDPEKEQMLSWASRYLDSIVLWDGTKTVDTSALRWPRTDVVDVDGICIDANTIPQQLKVATAETARFLLSEDPTSTSASDTAGALKLVKADVVEIEYHDTKSDSSSTTSKVPPFIPALVRGLGSVLSGGQRFIRIGR